MVLTVLVATVLCASASAGQLPPPESYTTTPDLESRRLTFDVSGHSQNLCGRELFSPAQGAVNRYDARYGLSDK